VWKISKDHSHNVFLDLATHEPTMMSSLDLPPIAEDLPRRRRMWSLLAIPLYDVLLDEATWAEDYAAIGRVARELGYSPRQVHRIYWREVVPAFLGAGSRMDLRSNEWLVDAIANRRWLPLGLAYLASPFWAYFAWACWPDIERNL
jgi:hypothetical protein